MRLALLRGADPDHLDIVHEGESFRVLVRRRPTARRLTLRVSSATGEVVMTLPTRTAIAVARTFAVSHGGWIAARLARMPERVEFAPDASVPLRGVPHRIVHRSPRSGLTRVETVLGEPVLSVACDAPHISRRVADFLQREARADLHAAVARYTAKLGRGRSASPCATPAAAGVPAPRGATSTSPGGSSWRHPWCSTTSSPTRWGTCGR